MRKFLACICFVLYSILVGEAQVPATVHAVWEPNQASDIVVQYLITLDTAAPITLLATACSATICSQALSIPTFGLHTVTLVAQNQGLSGLQSGPSVSVTFTLGAAPTVVAGLKITN